MWGMWEEDGRRKPSSPRQSGGSGRQQAPPRRLIVYDSGVFDFNCLDVWVLSEVLRVAAGYASLHWIDGASVASKDKSWPQRK